jgi:hypothetical protein
MRRLKDILWNWDPWPIGWRAITRLTLILTAVESLASIALIAIFSNSI